MMVVRLYFLSVSMVCILPYSNQKADSVLVRLSAFCFLMRALFARFFML
jgi:hypothetical protein